MAQVQLENVCKSFGDTEVVSDVNLSIAAGEFVVFVGPSGCGKSTLLRMIAGLEEISAGTLVIDGQRANETAASRRGVAMVFQSYALYPHMTVYKNMAFSLKLARVDPAEMDRRVREAAAALQLTEYLDRQPRMLSGGQRQRVAIGRAIVRNPKVFLFDEPLSNLDAALRVQTRIEIGRLHDRLDATMIYVTHDQVEAMTLADRIVVLNDGRIEQVGAPGDLYHSPRNMFVAGFIGSPRMNFVPVSVPSRESSALSGGKIEGAATMGVRPEHLSIVDDGDALLAGRVEVVENLGEHVLVHLSTESGTQFTAKLPDTVSVAKGGHLSFSAAADRLHWFDGSGGRL